MIAAIVQARMGSSRLPGKSAADLHGRSVLQRVLERVAAIDGLDTVVMATTSEPADDVLVAMAEGCGALVFRGPADDVLARHAGAARAVEATTIVRVTADCPLFDPAVGTRVLHAFLQRATRADYVSNTLRPTWPDGLDVEVFSRAALERADREARRPSEREHVTPYIYTQPDRFVLHGIAQDTDLSALRWTIDYPDDLVFLREVYRRLDRGVPFGCAEVLALLREESQLQRINAHHVRNEGYAAARARDAAPPDGGRTTAQSRALWARACRVIPGGTQTLSKRADQFVQGVAPIFLTHGRGSHVWDADGQEYIDYMMALGPVVLGYGAAPVDEAIRTQLTNGIQFSLSHPLEIELAELLTETIPCAELVRFAKNGSDVTAAAVRLARAVTGRDLIAACGYHGWQDWYIGSTAHHAGVPGSTRALTFRFAYNDAEDLEALLSRHRGEFAAVILEPVHGDEPRDGFLARVAALARAHGALMIFDEVKTGFRVALGGAQAYYGVTPDLACFGKAIANGMPLSALVGRREVMSALAGVFFSSTAGGETLSLAAALATVRTLQQTDALERIWHLGRRLRDGYAARASAAGLSARTRCGGLPPLLVTTFQDDAGRECPRLRSLFQQSMIESGILFDDGFLTCAAHTDDDIERTLDAVDTGLSLLRRAMEEGDVQRYLRGEAIRPIFP